ncbi:hypothetical protein DL764_005151 [Monosporascus ibericus]|uniref:Uncharacterized protein n=1 Tax=Monosporascus ibericus TaxID=155417 RepID=A0A4Q4TA07_9PEZI|nr:hypothetical protein DL764_005151 [Monosporascus ibericus]
MTTKQVTIRVQVDKTTSETDLTVMDQEITQVFGKSCSGTLNSGAFAALPISVELDDSSASNLSIGSAKYSVHKNVNVSSGITCGRMYDDAGIFVSCDATLPASLELNPLDKRDEPACFANNTPTLQSHKIAIMEGASAPLALTNVNLTDAEELAALEKRQGAYGPWSATTWKVGNGNPHQNYFHKQLSENMRCGFAPGCNVGQQQSTSFTIGFTATGSPATWISGGFSVSQSWITGNTYNCKGNRGDTVCIWYNTAHTAYTVQNGIINTVCGGRRPVGNPFILFSPNTGNVGGDYYYIIRARYCRSKGQGYWDKSGRAGGP